MKNISDNKTRLTPKMEKFARGIALFGLNQTDAYSKAYDVLKMTPKSINDASSKLAAHPAVAQRIEVLRERAIAVAVKKAGLTLADCIDEAGQMFEDAKSLGQISAGVAAAKLRAQLAGHLTEKKPDSKGPLDEMDVVKLLAIRDELAIRLRRAKEALELAGDPSDSGPPAPASFRRVIQ